MLRDMQHMPSLHEAVYLRQLSCAGPDRLKEALQSVGLKSGGTLRQRAERLWLTKDMPLEQLDKKLFVKGAANAVALTPAAAARNLAAAKQAAMLESKVRR